MSLPIRFSPESEETFEIVVEFLLDQWGEKFVVKFKSKVSKSLKAIGSNPFLYAIVDRDRQIRRCVLHGNCSMFYKIHDEHIQILYFWDNRQEPDL